MAPPAPGLRHTPDTPQVFWAYREDDGYRSWGSGASRDFIKACGEAGLNGSAAVSRGEESEPREGSNSLLNLVTLFGPKSPLGQAVKSWLSFLNSSLLSRNYPRTTKCIRDTLSVARLITELFQLSYE